MPLGEREGDNSKSCFCGVETEFTNDLSHVIDSNIVIGGFDFIVTPLMHPDYRPSVFLRHPELKEHPGYKSMRTMRFGGCDFTVDPIIWKNAVVGKISSWIDLDSEDETLRMDSKTSLKHEIEWASYLSLQACVLPPPKGTSWVNYARCVHQILQDLKNMQLWLRIPFGKPDDTSSASSRTLNDSWKVWNSFRLLCEHHSQLWVVLDNFNILPSESSLKRWYGEPVVAAILDTNIFINKNRGNGKFLSKRHQKLITDFFDHSIQIIISGKHVEDPFGAHSVADSNAHPLRPYLDYVGFLYKRMDPLSEQERFEFGIRDFLQPPFEPLKSYSEALALESFELDTAKYNQYKIAICKALLDRVPKKEASTITTVLVVVGAGRGPLLRASLEAAEETGRNLRVFAVEKNPNTAIALNELIRFEGWVDIVTTVTSDVRYWTAPEKADILVSDLLGSFGDNELSPESLDGAQRFLKKDGISIPSSYTSFLQPLTASKLYNDAKTRKDILNFETSCVVKIHNVARLTPSQQVFTFTHPRHMDKESNQRYKKLHFLIPDSAGSALVHGFAGYFDATLYKDVHLGNEPSTVTPNVFSWFPMFFPLRTPICVDPGSPLIVHFWRCCDSKKVWYEWCVTSPSSSPVHNCNGRSHWVEL